jgi:hypothetical protein
MEVATGVPSVTDPPEEGLLAWLDGPRLVVGAFAFFCLGLLVLLLVLWSDQRQQVERLDQLQKEHLAEQRVEAKETVETCFFAANQTPALRAVLLGLERESMSAESKQALRNFRELNTLNAPTLRECRQLAERLNVPIPRGKQ